MSRGLPLASLPGKERRIEWLKLRTAEMNALEGVANGRSVEPVDTAAPQRRDQRADQRGEAESSSILLPYDTSHPNHRV